MSVTSYTVYNKRNGRILVSGQCEEHNLERMLNQITDGTVKQSDEIGDTFAITPVESDAATQHVDVTVDPVAIVNNESGQVEEVAPAPVEEPPAE